MLVSKPTKFISNQTMGIVGKISVHRSKIWMTLVEASTRGFILLGHRGMERSSKERPTNLLPLWFLLEREFSALPLEAYDVFSHPTKLRLKEA